MLYSPAGGAAARTSKPVHHEILVRIRDDDGNIVLPGQFIEVAESLGMVQEIDMRVVEKAARHPAPAASSAARRCATS